MFTLQNLNSIRIREREREREREKIEITAYIGDPKSKTGHFRMVRFYNGQAIAIARLFKNQMTIQKRNIFVSFLNGCDFLDWI